MGAVCASSERILNTWKNKFYLPQVNQILKALKTFVKASFKDLISDYRINQIGKGLGTQNFLCPSHPNNSKVQIKIDYFFSYLYRV